MFDAGILRTHRMPVPVIAVGNITAGGTGKTTFVSELVRRLQLRGLKVGVVSRGFGRMTSGPLVVADGQKLCVDGRHGGDEPVMLAEQHPGAIVVVAERRVDAAGIAIERYGAEVLVADDGFQHRALGRDLNVLMVDARVDLRNELLLPSGLRREPLRGMRRADILAITRAENSEVVEHIARLYRSWFRGEVIGVERKSMGIELCGGADISRTAEHSSAFVFSGIGNHVEFLETVSGMGIEILGDIRFADHYWYRETDIDEILARFNASKAAVLLTTEKDLVRLDTEQALGARLRRSAALGVVCISANIVSGATEFDTMLDRVLERRAGTLT
jgi:tetraacyldisaccharide 4'-kinase